MISLGFFKKFLAVIIVETFQRVSHILVRQIDNRQTEMKYKAK